MGDIYDSMVDPDDGGLQLHLELDESFESFEPSAFLLKPPEPFRDFRGPTLPACRICRVQGDGLQGTIFRRSEALADGLGRSRGGRKAAGAAPSTGGDPD